MRRCLLTDLPTCRAYLQDQQGRIECDKLRQVAGTPLSMPEFFTAPAAKAKHHAYVGGLAVHTAQVLNTALAMATTMEEVDVDAIRTAVIWHDVQKIRDYRESVTEEEILAGPFVSTEHTRLIGHLSASFALFLETATEADLDLARKDHIGHIILAHHGRREWGSPVTPATTEAWIVHAADMLSAQFSQDAVIETRTPNEFQPK